MPPKHAANEHGDEVPQSGNADEPEKQPAKKPRARRPRKQPAPEFFVKHPGYISVHVNTRAQPVQQWQDRMLALGFDIVADGHYGRKSAIVCRDFQRRNDLATDGILGPVTWKATFEKPLPPTE